MTLEFNRIVDQIYKMGSMLEKLDFDVSERLSIARERFEAASDLSEVWERIEWVRESDISGYRGAAPLDLPNAEPINVTVPEPDMPDRATIIAADGSQVYPDELSPVHYYLINVGAFIYHHGLDHTPEQMTFPDLKFHKDHVHDRYGSVIRNSTVDDRRTVAEIQRLAEIAWERRQDAPHTVALYDNRLLYLPGGDDAQETHDNMNAFFGALVHLHDAGATLGGYIDNPHRSKRFVQLLYLLSIESKDELKHEQANISRAGDLDGLRDRVFFNAVLGPGERSAIMVQSSPQNKLFRDKGENYEIAFFYLKVSNAYQSQVVRVDIPVWVARDKARIDLLHSTLLQQCRLQGRNPYPYALTRADELAYVGGKDRAKLEELVSAQVRRVQAHLTSEILTAKDRGKGLARSVKRYHDMRGEEIIDER